ncbi:hypothetical protein ACGFQG_12725 [Nocardia fluminea]|uniref:hypothetical protein n=1 Tax=Nocardia fluminea TaxID=134984 RepID=UPI003712C319
MSTQTAKTNTARVLRPSRLNVAGWCIYCVTQNCTDARCIANHARAEWAVCGKCGGSEWVDGHTDPDTSTQRCDCVGGLTEATTPDAEVIDLHSYVVTYPAPPADEPRNDASGLVPRIDAGPAWDYHAAARQSRRDAEQANPEAVAYAKANPNSGPAQWAAYGMGY